MSINTAPIRATPVIRVLSALFALALLAPPPAAAAAAAGPEPVASEYLGSVTLLTGDHVALRRVGRVLVPSVEPAPGREHVQFATSGDGDRLLVVPSDAWPELHAGRLDRRLFDVAALIGAGRGDERDSDLRLIVRTAAPAAALAAAGASHYSTMDFQVVRQPKSAAADFWGAVRSGGVLGREGDRIWLDGTRLPSLDASVPRIGAPEAWRAGYTGAGVAVAVLDTGVDHTHPDLRDRVAATRDFTGGPDAADTDGHGTHVASILAGTGRASDGGRRGVAPGTRLLVGKVCGAGGCPESAILAGMEWAARSGARVVNLSLGGPDTEDLDPLEAAVDRLSAERGVLFVVAAGNDGGHGAETVSSPASADAALAVGAVDRGDVLAGFSGRGPRVRDAALKPEVVAPGVEISAARSRFSERGARGERYTALSGTSMATPHVAGAAAILAQQHPEWDGRMLKAALMASAQPLEDAGGYEQGAGRVDVARAITQTAYAEPAGVSMGRPPWPHDDDAPITRTVTYHNTTDHPLPLRLSIASTGPEGMFRLSAEHVVVPPRGQAAVDVTADTSLPAAEGAFTARITAEHGASRVTTPVVVDREPESHDLTLRAVDAQGRATDRNYAFVFGVDVDRYRPVPTVGGVGKVRVRKGRYHVDGVIATARPDGVTADSHKVVHPDVEVAADTTVVLDAAAARPIEVTFARPGVRPKAVGAGYRRASGDRLVTTGVLGDTFERIFLGQVGAPAEGIVADVGGAWVVPDHRGDTTTAEVAYHLAWFGHGRLPDGFARHVEDAGLAAVATTYRAQRDRRHGTKLWISEDPGGDAATGYGLPLRIPLARTEYHNADGPRWSAELHQWTTVRKAMRTEAVLVGGEVDHHPGGHYAEEWNSAVFSPTVVGGDWATRSGDSLSFAIPMHADAGVDRYGMSLMDSGSTTLHREGVEVDSTDTAGQGTFDVPPEPARYRLETTALRSGVSDYSTEISCAWEFTSARPEDGGSGKTGTPLPLMTIRFAPAGLDQDNTTTTDSTRVSLTVQRHRGTPPTPPTTLTIEASYDDGRTWHAVPLTRNPDVAKITHPHGTRHVSLRAKATDSTGDSVEQTVIRAYGI